MSGRQAERTAGVSPIPGGRNAVLGIVCLGGLGLAVILAAARVGEVGGRLSDWQALVLGITQGLTEFLPISSSGHLILVPWVANWHYLADHEEFNKTFDVALHLGTLIAVVLYFLRDIVTLVAAFVRSLGKRRAETAEEKVAWYVAIATVPAVIVGAALESKIDEHLGDPWQIAIFLGVFAVLLAVADRVAARREMGELGRGNALLLGIAQCLALMPGVSRSGITITAGRFLGLSRDQAARFSFLLLVPITAGAVVYKAAKHLHDLPAGSHGPFVVGTIAAAATGLLAIHALLAFVRSRGYAPFVVYRLGVVVAIVILIAAGVRESTF